MKAIYTLSSLDINIGKGRSRGRVTRLPKNVRDLITYDDATIVLSECEPCEGCTYRVVVKRNNRYYTRMPSQLLMSYLENR